MVAHGRAVQQAEIRVPRATSGAATVLRVQAAPSNIVANFQGTHTYLFFVCGRIGAFVAGATNPSLPATVQFGTTTSAGVFTERGTQVKLDSGAAELQDNGLAGAGRVGFPFVMVVRHTMGATADDVEIRAHAGDAAGAYLSDLAIWWWDTASFPTQYLKATGPTTLPRYPTWTAQSPITAAWGGGIEQHLVMYSVEVGFADPANAWRSRVTSGASFATTHIGNVSGGAREIGSRGVGSVAAPWVQSLGMFRAFQMTSGTEQFRIETASSQSSTANPQQVLYSATIASVKLANPSVQYTASKASLFGVNSVVGQDRFTFTPAINNDTQSGENYLAAVACTHGATGTSQRGKLALNLIEIAGNQGLHVWNGDSTCGVPVISLANERQLAGLPQILDFRGLRNSYETPQGAAQTGFDVTELAVPVNALPSTPVPTLPGAEVALIPGMESPSLAALSALPVEPSYALTESRQFASRRFQFDTGHVVAHPMFASPRAQWDLSWDNLSATDYATLMAFLEARSATAWKWRPQHETAEQAFVLLGGAITDDTLAPAVFSVRAKALQLLWVGP